VGAVRRPAGARGIRPARTGRGRRAPVPAGRPHPDARPRGPARGGAGLTRNVPGTAPGYRLRMSKKPSLTVVAWSAGAVSLAGFVAAWVLAARNGDLSDITAEFGPDRFMIAYAVAGTVLAARRRSNP